MQQYGNVPDAYATATARSHVWLMLVAGIVIDYAAHITPGAGSSLGSQARKATHEHVNLAGWAVLFVFMTFLTDLPATTTLAESFALLILLAALFLHGEKAAANVQKLIANANATKTGA